jgi:hypothetical protein
MDLFYSEDEVDKSFESLPINKPIAKPIASSIEKS